MLMKYIYAVVMFVVILPTLFALKQQEAEDHQYLDASVDEEISKIGDYADDDDDLYAFDDFQDLMEANVKMKLDVQGLYEFDQIKCLKQEQEQEDDDDIKVDDYDDDDDDDMYVFSDCYMK